MTRFIVRRMAQTVIVLVLISIFTFLIFQVIPNGDPAARLAGRTASPDQIRAIARSWGFDQPIYVQYLRTMQKIFSGSVVSYSQQINVVDQIRRGLPATVSLAVGAGVIWLLFGIVVGLLSALRPGRVLDRVLGFLALTAISTPAFVLGAVLLYVFAYRTSILPTGEYVPLTDDPWQWFRHLVLPWISLSLAFIGFYSRVLRGNVLDAKHEEYVRMARAKGLSGRRVMVRHVLRNSLIPIVSLWGLDFAGVIGGGAILIESIFDLRGVGQYAAESISTLDVPPIMVIVMYTGVLVVVVAALVDILYAYLDPRISLNT
ncbi:MAG TPA: ABC transporter permease [Gaiellaceae bacterium]|nr:ABC transporter permease [Gaiellaceae bacterium]